MAQEVFKSGGAKATLYLDGPDWEGEACATLGGLTSKTCEEAKDVIAQAIIAAQAKGVHRMIGPMEGDTWHSYRLVTETDGSPAFLMEPREMSAVLDALRAAGFDQIGSYFSARVPLEQAGLIAPDSTEAFAVEAWDGADPENLFGQVFDLSCEAFAKNVFYKPISRDAFLAMYMPMVPMLKRELIFFARKPDGALAGFLFGTPNYAEGPAPESVILKTYASLMRGAGQHLAHAFHTAAAEGGYKTAIHALIHEDNLSALRSASEGADVFRRYGLFGRVLDV